MENDISDPEHYRRQAEHLQERVQELEQSLAAAKQRPLPSTFDAMMCMMGTMEALCAHLGVHPGTLKAFIDARYESLELLPPDRRGEPAPLNILDRIQEQIDCEKVAHSGKMALRSVGLGKKAYEQYRDVQSEGVRDDVVPVTWARILGDNDIHLTWEFQDECVIQGPNPFTDLPHGGGA